MDRIVYQLENLMMVTKTEDLIMSKDVDLNQIASDYSNRFLKFFERNIQLLPKINSRNAVD